MYNKINVLVEREQDDDAVAEINKFIEKYPDNTNVEELKNLQVKLEHQLSSSR